MAWNPSMEVKIAREVAAQLAADQVVVVYLRRSAGKIGAISYGRTSALCKDAKKLADAAYNAVRAVLQNPPPVQNGGHVPPAS